MAPVLIGLTLPKIIHPATVVALGVDLCAPCRHLIELTVGVPLLGGGGRWLYEQKLLKYRTLVVESAIWAQLLRRQVAYGVHGLQRDVSSGHYFFGSVSPIKTDATFFFTKR